MVPRLDAGLLYIVTPNKFQKPDSQSTLCCYIPIIPCLLRGRKCVLPPLRAGHLKGRKTGKDPKGMKIGRKDAEGIVMYGSGWLIVSGLKDLFTCYISLTLWIYEMQQSTKIPDSSKQTVTSVLIIVGGIDQVNALVRETGTRGHWFKLSRERLNRNWRGHFFYTKGGGFMKQAAENIAMFKWLLDRSMDRMGLEGCRLNGGRWD